MMFVEKYDSEGTLKALAQSGISKLSFEIMKEAGVVAVKKFFRQNASYLREGIINEIFSWTWSCQDILDSIMSDVQHRYDAVIDTSNLQRHKAIGLFCDSSAEHVIGLFKKRINVVDTAPSVIRAFIVVMTKYEDEVDSQEKFLLVCLDHLYEIMKICDYLNI